MREWERESDTKRENCKENAHVSESMKKLSSEIEGVVTERMFGSGIWITFFLFYVLVWVYIGNNGGIKYFASISHYCKYCSICYGIYFYLRNYIVTVVGNNNTLLLAYVVVVLCNCFITIVYNNLG